MKKGTRLRFGKDVYKYVCAKEVMQTPSAIALLGNPAKAHVLQRESDGKIKMVSGAVLEKLKRLPDPKAIQLKQKLPCAYLLFCNGPRKGKRVRLRVTSPKLSDGLLKTHFPPSLKINAGEKYMIVFSWSKQWP